VFTFSVFLCILCIPPKAFPLVVRLHGGMDLDSLGPRDERQCVFLFSTVFPCGRERGPNLNILCFETFLHLGMI
jgi:hypothetical protein